MLNANLEKALDTIASRTGKRALLCWQMPGPKNSQVEYQSMYMFGEHLVYVQQLEGQGWEMFLVAHNSNSVGATINAVCDRINGGADG